MPASPTSSRIRLALSEDGLTRGVIAPWIGPLVALGGLAGRYARTQSERQLIVAVTVPRRDFAAVLVACGWVVSRPAPPLSTPLDLLGAMEPGAPVRVVTEREVVADYFVGLNRGAEPTLKLRGSQWLLSKIEAVAPLRTLDKALRTSRPHPGTLAKWGHLETTYAERLAAPAADLAIVGTLDWLRQDLAVSVSTDEVWNDRVSRRSGVADTIGGLLLPRNEQSATWFTTLFAASRLADQLPLPSGLRATILDGSGAIKYLAEIESPVVICILDRSIADDAAGELIVQLRNSRGEPVSLKDGLGWRPPMGIEALGFTVPL